MDGVRLEFIVLILIFLNFYLVIEKLNEAKEFKSNKTNSKFSKNYLLKGGQPQFGFGIKF